MNSLEEIANEACKAASLLRPSTKKATRRLHIKYKAGTIEHALVHYMFRDQLITDVRIAYLMEFAKSVRHKQDNI